MRTMKRSTRIAAEKELVYCKARISEGSRLEHWFIRVAEIEKQLKRKK